MNKINTTNLKDLKLNKTDSNKEPKKNPLKKNVKTSSNHYYATGKRKSSVARVWLKSGKGVHTVNGKSFQDYFPCSSMVFESLEPLKICERLDKIDILCTVSGGGNSGQAGSIRHGIAKALNIFDPNLHTKLKNHKLLTRDSRVVERKKPGQHKARKRHQFSKR